MSEKLQKPPLVEAVIELRFSPRTWSQDEAGAIRNALGPAFQTPESTLSPELQLVESEGGVVTQAVQSQRWQLKRTDGTAMIQLADGALVVNHLRPYDKWETFRALIVTALEAHNQVRGDVSISRRGLRYINHIPFSPGPEYRIRDVLTTRPALNDALERRMSGFYQRYDLVHTEPPGILIHQTALLVVAPGPDGAPVPAILLDLDFSSAEDISSVKLAEISEWLDKAHEQIGLAFRASIQDRVFERFRTGEQ